MKTWKELPRQRWSIILLCCFTVTLGCAKKQEEKALPRPVRAIQITEASDVTSRTFPGLASPYQEVDLSFRITGPLVELPIKVGDDVKKDDLLARVDPRDYEVAVQKFEGELGRAKAELLRAASDYERALRIQSEHSGAITERAIEQAQETRDGAIATVKSLEAQLDDAKNQLKDTDLRAPFDGRIVANYVENFEYVTAQQSITRILDTSSTEMVIYVPEAIIALVSNIESIKVRFDLYPNTELEATIKELGTEAMPTTHTYPVTLTMPPPENISIFSGMAGNATIQVRIPDDSNIRGVEVPPTAIAEDREGHKYLWVIDEHRKTVSRRYVDVGWITDTGVLITKNLKPDEWVATAGVHYLEEDQEVRILKQ